MLGFVTSCSITAPSGRTEQSSDLARNRQRWATAQLHDYEFDYRLLCFCAPDATEAVHVVVRADVIVSVVRKRDGLPAATVYGGGPRVDELFAAVQRAIDQHPARLDVTYDATYGYPTSIIVDVELMAVDDESSISAGNLRALR